MWFVIVLVCLAVLITLILSIPLELILRANTEGQPKLSLKLIWLFGLMKRELAQSRQKSGKKRVRKSEQKPGTDWVQRIKTAFEIIQTRGLVRQLKLFLRRTYKSIHIKELAANLKVDLENPADTGLLFAFIAPANLALNYFVPYSIQIQPAFAGDALASGYVNCGLRIIPIQIAGAMLGLAFSMPALRIAKRMVVSRWKRKR